MSVVTRGRLIGLHRTTWSRRILDAEREGCVTIGTSKRNNFVRGIAVAVELANNCMVFVF